MSTLLRRSALPSLVLLAAVACGGSADAATGPSSGSAGSPTGSQGRVPSEIVGTWLNGSVSPTNFYNPTTGSWSNGYGTGLFYRFNADGTFEYGWQTYSSLYSCSERATVYRKGTLAVDESRHTVVLHSSTSVVHGESTCSSTSTYTKPGPMDDETLIWDWDHDQYGNTYLLLRWPTTTYSQFHRP
jgi:hypothetical protein